MAPPAILQYVVIHELAHLKQSAQTYVEFSKEYAMVAQEETEDEA